MYQGDRWPGARYDGGSAGASSIFAEDGLRISYVRSLTSLTRWQSVSPQFTKITAPAQLFYKPMKGDRPLPVTD